jgi:periplasmic protein TonB
MKAGSAEVMRWSACFALALCFHAAGAAALLARWNESADLGTNAPIITIELGPVAVSPNITPSDSPDTQLSKLAEPEPQPEVPFEKIEAPLAPQAELQITPPPKEKPKDKKPRQKHANVNSMPIAAEQPAERAAAPMLDSASRNPNAVSDWKSQLRAQIERHKHFEGSERGVVQVAISIDRSGNLRHTRVVGSSGSSVLDHDAIAWLERSRPLPPPPPEMVMVPITVPLRYNML